MWESRRLPPRVIRDSKWWKLLCMGTFDHYQCWMLKCYNTVRWLLLVKQDPSLQWWIITLTVSIWALSKRATCPVRTVPLRPLLTGNSARVHLTSWHFSVHIHPAAHVQLTVRIKPFIHPFVFSTRWSWRARLSSVQQTQQHRCSSGSFYNRWARLRLFSLSLPAGCDWVLTERFHVSSMTQRVCSFG